MACSYRVVFGLNSNPEFKRLEFVLGKCGLLSYINSIIIIRITYEKTILLFFAFCTTFYSFSRHSMGKVLWRKKCRLFI